MNVNKVFIGGRLVRDTELKQLESGTSVCSFSIAENERYKKGEEWVEKANYFECSIFGKRAEALNKYFEKGSEIFIIGKLDFQQWEAKDGQKRNALRVIAEDFQFVGATQKSKEPEPTQEEEENEVYKSNVPF
jgi:single-strand DNA-binding protein